MKKNTPELYFQYFVQKDDERLALFKILKELYSPKKGLYPGSFVHITPSFFIESMVYVDTDKRMTKFFRDPVVDEYIADRKNYRTSSSVSFLQSDFTKPLPLEDSSFDILVSLYAGFISQHCKRKLKMGGILVANNSHGDSSIAFTDQDYELIAVIKRKGKKFSLTSEGLDSYFRKKNGSPIDTSKVLDKMVGEAFTKAAYAYVFKRIH